MEEANEFDADDDNLSPIQRMRKQYEEKPEESGGWSIRRARRGPARTAMPKPDPPWLAAAKKRPTSVPRVRPKSVEREPLRQWGSKPQSGIDMEGMKAQYQKPRWADIFGMGGGKEATP